MVLQQFANTPPEVHAIAHGLYDGYFRSTDPGHIPKYDDVQAEPHYYKGGYLVGHLAQKYN